MAQPLAAGRECRPSLTAPPTSCQSRHPSRNPRAITVFSDAYANPRPARLGRFQLVYRPTLTSTNDLAQTLVRAGVLTPPAVVVTGHQTHGRGRRGRSWLVGGDSAVTATFVVGNLPHAPGEVALVVAVLLRRALERDLKGRVPVLLKWPNDLFLGSGKLAGVLIERVLDTYLIGVGINVTRPPALPDDAPAAALADAVAPGVPPPIRGAVLAAVAETLAHLPTRRWRDVAEEYAQHHLLHGRRVRLEDGTVDLCHGVDTDGQLIVGARHVASGTVRLAE